MPRERKPFYFIPFFIIAMLLVLAGVVMFLWNNLMPQIFNLRTITYGQAVGLLVLCRILFGSFRPGPPGGRGRGGPPWRTKLMNMTSEEREQFRQEWLNRGCRKDAGKDAG